MGFNPQYEKGWSIMDKKWFDVLLLGIPYLFKLVFKLIDRKKKRKNDDTADKTG